ncbi:MAG: YhdH/YhfP family quinone oxidoreductase [Bacteroidales bacterium]|jgi:putative YhdH/YhfP family quinone oxidoreductase|nr:YhdH/YhfP family quinone oxidoreductase [Bacteroidales bacterium]
MNTLDFKALLVSEKPDGTFIQEVVKRKITDLPDNELLIKVNYSSLNYKDALSATGHKGVSKFYPHTPGIDASGLVAFSRDKRFKPGDEVIVTGYDLGMNTPGGFAEYISVPGDWVVPLPQSLSLKEAMMLGTAGFTAAYALYKLIEGGQKPENGPVLVTGATGGVGSLAVALLSKAGFEVIAATGKPDSADYLKALGANRITDRGEVNDTSGKPLMKPKWAGAIDTVGGNVLATVLKACQKHGNVAAMGNVLSVELHTTVFPFILNGINLLGVDSATCPMSIRQELWKKLGNEWKPDKLEMISSQCYLEDLPEYISKILKGEMEGRKLLAIR